jgi:arsenite methyltransferase
MITPGDCTKAEMLALKPAKESVFDRFSWFYAFCRERLFRDDTEEIIASLWQGKSPQAGENMLEIGCGPGFYATRLAKRFPALQVMGLDRCGKLLEHSRARARLMELSNCRFERDDILALAQADASADVIVLSRLLMMVGDRTRALSEVHRVLRPGGACFVAEPCSPFRAALPLVIMWAMVYALTVSGGARPSSYGERKWPGVMNAADFEALMHSQPWASVRCWRSGYYQYALCRK